mmetsp:Transcript_9022/g.23691  ORF Transcript_9022/g.23691 Transcript_9022/m.23691 type:complete len:208 (+) Transcript_9022:2791-3414(+)
MLPVLQHPEDGDVRVEAAASGEEGQEGGHDELIVARPDVWRVAGVAAVRPNGRIRDLLAAHPPGIRRVVVVEWLRHKRCGVPPILGLEERAVRGREVDPGLRHELPAVGLLDGLILEGVLDVGGEVEVLVAAVYGGQESVWARPPRKLVPILVVSRHPALVRGRGELPPLVGDLLLAERVVRSRRGVVRGRGRVHGAVLVRCVVARA